jgi:polysaccharide chain length determinant protein (PEP-CTERM system associated)
MQELFAQLLLILRGAWRYRWHGLALTWFLSLLGWGIVASIPDTFEARTKVYVDTDSLLKPLLQGIAVNRDVVSQVAMMQAVMLSRPNLEKVAHDTDLFLDSPTRRQQEKMLDELSSRVTLTSSTSTGRRAPQGGTFSVAFEDEDPKVAYQVVQSLLNTFMEDSLGMKRSDAGVAQRFLQTQLSEYEQKLISAETRLAEFKKANVGLMPGAEGDYYQRLDGEMGKLETLQSRYRQVSERRNELQRQLSGEEPTFGLMGGLGTGDPIDGQIAGYQARIDQLLVQYTEKHPEVVALQETIDRLRKEKMQGATVSPSLAPPGAGPASSEDLLVRSLDMNPVYQNLKMSLSTADAELAELRGELAAQQQTVANLRSKVDAIPEVEAELSRLNRDYQVNKTQYDEMLQRLESARISEQADQSTEDVKFRVIEPPVEPITPSGPHRAAMSTVVLLLSLAAGLALAFLLQQLRPVFSTRDSVQQITGLPVIGAVTAAIVEGFVPWYRRQTALVGGALAALLVVFLLNLLLQDNVRATMRNFMG